MFNMGHGVQCKEAGCLIRDTLYNVRWHKVFNRRNYKH